MSWFFYTDVCMPLLEPATRKYFSIVTKLSFGFEKSPLYFFPFFFKEDFHVT